MPQGIIARKIGMTRLFAEDGTVTPVTVLEAGPCPVTAVRTVETDGYSATQIAFEPVAERKISKAEIGHLKKAGVAAHRHVVEIRDMEGTPVGESVTVSAFEEGATVKMSGISQGKGFQGNIKRHGHHRGPMSHGSHNKRAPGSIGASAWPARVMKGIKLPGQMGAKRITQPGGTIMRVDAEKNLLLVKGSVPGPRGGVIFVKEQS